MDSRHAAHHCTRPPRILWRYVLLVISMIYVTLPSIRGVKEYNPSRAYLSFWWMTISMVFIVLTITGAGMVQSYMERLMGLTMLR